MKYIDKYKEFGEVGGDSVKEHCSQKVIVGKQAILKYLKREEYKVCTNCHLIYDILKNKTTVFSSFDYSDGEYEWSSEEIYHFEQYNMVLNQEFIDKVLEVNKNEEIEES